MDTQRCQNHGPVRVLVPLLEFNHDLLGMLCLKIPRLTEVPSKAVVISDVTQHGDSLSVQANSWKGSGSVNIVTDTSVLRISEAARGFPSNAARGKANCSASASILFARCWGGGFL